MKRQDKAGLQNAARWAALAEANLRIKLGAYSPNLGGACNSRKTHPLIAAMGYPIWCNRHAEMDLVLRYGEQLKYSTVYVARLLLKDGSLGMAMPCPFCMHVLSDVGVYRVVWSEGPDTYGEIKL